jgi:hypothetical protein
VYKFALLLGNNRKGNPQSGDVSFTLG